MVLFAVIAIQPNAIYAQQTTPRKANTLKVKEEPKLPVVQIDFQYTYQQPFGMLNERFGGFNAIGIGASYRAVNALTVGFDLSALWGGNVKDNGRLDSITGPTGSLIDNNGNPAVMRLYMLGYHSNAYLGYLVRTSRANPNNGVMLRLGAGFLQHRIRYQHTINVMPQLEDDMFKGYDQLTYGFMTTQFIGYQYSSLVKIVNFWGGIELSQGFTQNRREFDYATRMPDTEPRRDFLIGFKAGFMIPIFLHGKGAREGSEIFFN